MNTVQRKSNKPTKDHLVNKDIPYSRMFVIGPDGAKLGVMSKFEALTKAADAGFDLVVISDNPQQPVAKILDYGKWLYEKNKKTKESKAKQVVIENKEVRLTAMIGDHDLQTKAKKAREMLIEGARVKVSLKLKGREIGRQDLGHDVLAKFYELCKDVAVIDKDTTLNGGRFLDMYLKSAKANKVTKEDSHAKNENKESADKKN